LPLTTSSLEMEWAYSYFGASEMCHLRTYLDTYSLSYSPGPTQGTQLTNTVFWCQAYLM